MKHVSQPNLICTLPGQTESVIIAHFDHVQEGDGVVDNWSGASLLPSLYQSLNRIPRRHTFLFIAFAGEEQGLVGSESYVNHMSKEDVDRTEAMINMDSLGLPLLCASSRARGTLTAPPLPGTRRLQSSAQHSPRIGPFLSPLRVLEGH